MSFSEPRQIRDTFFRALQRVCSAQRQKLPTTDFCLTSIPFHISSSKSSLRSDRQLLISSSNKQSLASTTPLSDSLLCVQQLWKPPPDDIRMRFLYIFFQHMRVLKQQQRAERNTQTSEHDSEKMTKRKYEDKRGLSPAFMNSEIRGKNSVWVWCKLWNIFSLNDSSSR